MAGLEPARYAVEVEGVLSNIHISRLSLIGIIGISYIADTPSDGALLAGGTCLVGLAVDAQVHDVVAADGAVVDDDIPRPQRDCVPLSNLKVSTTAFRFLRSKYAA